MKFILNPGTLSFSDLKTLLDESTVLELNPESHAAIHAAEKLVDTIISQNKTVYGINTGFGALAHTRIDAKELHQLQDSIVLSHATGTGAYLSDQVVRLILILKINSLARGYSGVRLETIDALIKLLNNHIYPRIPAQGSVGASGDLAPLAHLVSPLLGFGEAHFQGKVISAEEVLTKIGLSTLNLAPKEGLALLNGTQVSTALALDQLFAAEKNFISALIAGALSVDAARASTEPFDDRIQRVRGHLPQIKVATCLRQLLAHSEIRRSHEACHKVQDPYSLRCQPQVMGACLQSILTVRPILLIEANAVSDNPLVFSESNEVLSGGNFHAEPVALAADQLAISIAEIGALSERRIALLTDTNYSGLPSFLVRNAGINSGFMMAHVTAAALASENKSLSHPASVDSLPTSANQEDHVSMATYAARRLIAMNENTACIIGIELLAACQGVDLLAPLRTSPLLEKIHHIIREEVAFYDKDRYFAPDIAKAKRLVEKGIIAEALSEESLIDLIA